jgi:hypothetical protein
VHGRGAINHIVLLDEAPARPMSAPEPGHYLDSRNEIPSLTTGTVWQKIMPLEPV